MVMKALRDASSGGLGKFILFGFLVLAVAGLALMDVGGFFRGGTGSNNVVKIKDQKISIQDFDRSAQRQLQPLGIAPKDAYQMGYMNQIIAGEIRKILTTNLARTSGLEISQARVVAHINKLIEPMAQQGQSPQSVLQQILMNQRLSENAFEQAIRGEMQNSLLNDAIAPSKTPINQSIIDGLYQYEHETRAIEYLKFHDSEIEIDDPDEETLQYHYDLHREEYKIPETRAVEIIMLDESKITADASRSAADILDHKLELAEQLEDLQASDIALSDIQAQLPVITASIAELGVYGQIPDQLNKPIPDDIKDNLSPLAKEAFSLQEGESSIAIELSGAKFATVKIIAITPQSYHSLEKVKKQIIQNWKKQQQHKETLTRTQKVKDQITNEGISFKAYADTNKRNYRTAENLTRKEITPPFTAQAMARIFETSLNHSQILEIDGGYILAKLTKASVPEIGETTRKKKAYKDLQDTMQSSAGAQLFGTLLDGEHAKTPALINTKLLERIYGAQSEYY